MARGRRSRQGRKSLGTLGWLLLTLALAAGMYGLNSGYRTSLDGVGAEIMHVADR